jgi:hypothetical protein
MAVLLLAMPMLVVNATLQALTTEGRARRSRLEGGYTVLLRADGSAAVADAMFLANVTFQSVEGK